MKATTETNLGTVIRARRDARRMTLAQLSAASGLDLSHLSKIERGLTITSPTGYERIAAALGCSTASLYRDAARAGAA